MKSKSAIHTFLALCALGLLAGPAMAQHTCSASTAAQFQSCLDDAVASGNDSVITLAAGTFNISGNGNMPFTYVVRPACNSGAQAHSLTITGAGAGATILDGNDEHQVLHIRHDRFGTVCWDQPLGGTEIANDNDDSGATITVENVTVRNGHVQQIPVQRDGSGTSCSFVDASEDAGGLAIKVYQSEIVVENNRFEDNSGHEGGGAKLHKSCGSAGITLANSLFEGNETRRMAAFDFFFDPATCDISLTDTGGLTARTLGTRTTQSGGGAKVSARDGLVTIADNEFIANQAGPDVNPSGSPSIWGTDGGGLSGKGIFGLGQSGAANTPSCPNSNSPWAVEVEYFESWADAGVGNDTGGADTILVGGSIWMIERNLFRENIVHGGDGGGAHLWGNMMVVDNQFIGNETRLVEDREFSDAADGGGLHIFTRNVFGDAVLTRNLFQNNSAKGEGGGLQLRSPRHRVDVTASVFSGNASEGHVQSNFEGHVSQGGGGGAYLYTDDGTVNFINNSVCNNVAVAGFAADRDRPSGHGGGVVAYIQLSDDEWGTDDNDPSDSFDLPAVANIYNNIMWGNSADPDTGLGDDLFIEDLHAGSNSSYYWSGGTISDDEGSEINLFSNNFADLAHLCADDPDCTADLTQGGNTSIDPVFEDLDECRLSPDSPLLAMAGTPGAPGQPTVDYDGNPINPESPILGAIGLGIPAVAPLAVPIFSLPGLAFLAVLMLLATILVRRSRRAAG